MTANTPRLRCSLVWCLSAFAVTAATPAPITPKWPTEGEPSFPPGSTMWMKNNIKACPVAYRHEVEVSAEVQAVAGVLTSTEYAYVYVDGELAAEFADRHARRDRPAVKVSWPVTLDLTPWLTPGRHALVLSAPGSGVDLQLVAFTANGERRLETDPSWRAWKFPPLTMLRREPCLRVGFDDSLWFAVTAGKTVQRLTPADARATAAEASVARRKAARDEAQWRLDMLTRRGWAIRDWQVRGFAGAGRVSEPLLALAETPEVVEGHALAAADALTGLAWLLDEETQFTQLARHWDSRNAADLATLTATAAKAANERLATLRQAIGNRDWAAASKTAAAALSELSEVRHQLREQTGVPVNLLNQSYLNRAGWIDVPQLMGNHLPEWGLRVNPVEVSWKVALAGKWRFRLDPDNRGLGDTVHTLGYNIENQWDQITVPGPWEGQGYQDANPNHPKDNPFTESARTDGPYNGYAWYRRTIQVPAEWAGHNLELSLGAIDDFDWTYFNGELIGKTGRDQPDWWRHPRVYRVPKQRVFFGQPNVIAIRVYDEADKGGLVSGPVELRCPSLRQTFTSPPAKRPLPVTVFESPLFPSALLTLSGKRLSLSGWVERSVRGPEAAFFQQNGQLREVPLDGGEAQPYQRDRDGGWTANWLCLWPGATDVRSGELPMQLLCESQPVALEVERSPRGVLSLAVEFDKPGRWVQLLRPFRDPPTLGDRPTTAQVQALTFWSQAALAYPTDYSEIAQRAGAGALQITDRYTYRPLSDDWQTKPVTLAPLPPLASYAAEVKLPGLALPTDLVPLHVSLGEWGELHAVIGSDSLTYTVPVDPLPRLAGFTDFAFSGPDLGGPGNEAEVRLIRATGCNSWRPQSNNLDERMQRTIRLANAHGLNLMTNVDNRFGATDQVFAAYRALARWVMEEQLPPHAVAYDLINEPANMTPEVYNPRVARLAAAIREIDPIHPIYVETPHSYAAVSQFVNLKPLAVDNVVYSFHDYNFRLTPRWPAADRDRRSLVRHWLPAIRFGLEHNAPIHLGEFGGFHQTPHDPWHNRSTLTLLSDMFTLFDQFGWHFHYYSNRGEWTVRPDGSLDGNLVHSAFERYFAQHTLNPFEAAAIQ